MKVRARYRTAYIDPPWPERGGGKIQRGADRHYDTMKVPAIQSLIDGVINLNSRYRLAWDAHLYLWATNNYLPHAITMMAGLGFRYVTMVTWLKGTIEIVSGENLAPTVYDRYAQLKLQMGLGQYYRGCTEHCLFGVRGRIPYRLLPSGKRAQGMTGFVTPRLPEHSRKPETMRQMIERVSPGPYLELFARRPMRGWTVWGNEV